MKIQAVGLIIFIDKGELYFPKRQVTLIRIIYECKRKYISSIS